MGEFYVPRSKMMTVATAGTIDLLSPVASTLGRLVAAEAEDGGESAKHRITRQRELSSDFPTPVSDLLAAPAAQEANNELRNDAAAQRTNDANANDNDAAAVANERQNSRGSDGRSRAAADAYALVPKEVVTALSQLTLHDNRLYTNPRANQEPKLGDNRVEWKVAFAPQEASVIGLQRNGVIVPYKTSNGREMYLVGKGEQSPAQLITQARENADLFALAMRALAAFGMFFGLWLALQPAVIAPQFLPLVGGLLSGCIGCGALVVALVLAVGFALITIALAWMSARPIVSIATIGAVLAGWYALQRANKSRQARHAGAEAGAASTATAPVGTGVGGGVSGSGGSTVPGPAYAAPVHTGRGENDEKLD